MLQELELADRKIRVIREDAEGFFWLGTANGFCRFDGRDIQLFEHVPKDSTSLGGRHINDILVDNTNGILWIAHDRGLTAYDREMGTMRNYKHNTAISTSLPDDHMTELHQTKDGEMWIGTRESGLYRYRAATDDFDCIFFTIEGMKKYELNSIYEILPDPEKEHILWIGTKSGIVRLHTKTRKYKHYYQKSGNPEYERYVNMLPRMYFHDDGNLYFSSWLYGVHVFNPHTETFYTNEELSPPHSEQATQFWRKSNQEIWVSLDNSLRIYNVHLQKYVQSWENNHAENIYYSVDYIDRKGQIWSIYPNYYHAEAGAKIYAPLSNQTNTYRYERREDIMCLTRKILEDTIRDLLYVLPQEGEGLYVMDMQTKQWRTIPVEGKYYKSHPKHRGFSGWDMLLTKEGELFILDASNIYQISPNGQYLQSLDLSFPVDVPRLRCIEVDANGNMWLGSSALGLSKYDPQTQTFVHYTDRLTESRERRYPEVRFLEIDDNGTLWMRYINGVTFYNPQKDTFINVAYEAGTGRAHRGMRGFVMDDHRRVWATGVEYGIGYGYIDSLDQGFLQWWDADDGMDGAKANGIVEVEDGKLLLMTDYGLQIFNPVSLSFEQSYSYDYGIGQLDESMTYLSTGSGHWASVMRF